MHYRFKGGVGPRQYDYLSPRFWQFIYSSTVRAARSEVAK